MAYDEGFVRGLFHEIPHPNLSGSKTAVAEYMHGFEHGRRAAIGLNIRSSESNRLFYLHVGAG